MQSYLTPDETAQHLRVDVQEIMSLIQQGKMKAIRIGENLRIPEAEIERLEITCAAVGATEMTAAGDGETTVLAEGARWVNTRTGRAKFRIAGSVAEGAQIWPGRMRYPIRFPKQFMRAMRERFCGKEVAVGGKFDDPGSDSLGEFIQQQLKIKMNPAVYVAALLIDEGFAVSARRGHIRFLAG